MAKTVSMEFTAEEWRYIAIACMRTRPEVFAKEKEEKIRKLKDVAIRIATKIGEMEASKS